METQNVTLSIPKETLRKAKILAVERQTSLSALLASTLEDIVNQEEGYAAARRRQLALFEQGFNLGTGGKVSWSRDSLHER